MYLQGGRAPKSGLLLSKVTSPCTIEDLVHTDHEPGFRSHKGYNMA